MLPGKDFEWADYGGHSPEPRICNHFADINHPRYVWNQEDVKWDSLFPERQKEVQSTRMVYFPTKALDGSHVIYKCGKKDCWWVKTNLVVRFGDCLDAFRTHKAIDACETFVVPFDMVFTDRESADWFDARLCGDSIVNGKRVRRKV